MEIPVVAQYVEFQRGTGNRLELIMGMDWFLDSPFAFSGFPCGNGDISRRRRIEA